MKTNGELQYVAPMQLHPTKGVVQYRFFGMMTTNGDLRNVAWRQQRATQRWNYRKQTAPDANAKEIYLWKARLDEHDWRTCDHASITAFDVRTSLKTIRHLTTDSTTLLLAICRTMDCGGRLHTSTSSTLASYVEDGMPTYIRDYEGVAYSKCDVL